MAVDALARAIAAGKTPVTAYDEAVKAGYTGTEEQFAQDMGNSAINAANAAASASAAAASAESISASAAQIATNTSDISDLKESIGVVVEEKPGINIFPGYTEPGGIINTNGSDNDSADALSNYVRSDYFPVDPTNSTLYVLRQTALWGLRLFWYDENKDFISQTQMFNGSVTVLSGQTSIPNNAKFIRTYRGNTVDSWVVLSYTAQSEYTPYSLEYVIKENIVAENNLTSEVKTKLNKAENLPKIETDLITTKNVNFFDGSFPNSGYIYTDGTNHTGSNYKRTNYIPVDDSYDTIYFVRSATPYLLAVCFYSAESDSSAVGTVKSIFGASVTDTLNFISIPENAAYIRMYTNATTDGTTLMLSYTEDETFYPYGDIYCLKNGVVIEDNLADALKEKINSGIYPLAGKTIAFMGDSIIGNYYDSTGVCAVLAKRAGANVINCAFGGSRMAYRYGSNPQYQYWNALSGVELATAISTGVWTAQDTAVSTMSEASSYFSDRLNTLKSIDWTTVDFVMWEYGTNDFMTDVALSNDSDPTDMYAFENAYRKAIETILTAYPNIRIITATPMYRWYMDGDTFREDSNTYTKADYNGITHTLIDFIESAEKVSKEYQIPCIDDYYTLGANKFTRLAFFNSNDGTHPKAEGRKRLAEHIGGQLMSLV